MVKKKSLHQAEIAHLRCSAMTEGLLKTSRFLKFAVQHCRTAAPRPTTQYKAYGESMKNAKGAVRD
jgi:hypothetical protein